MVIDIPLLCIQKICGRFSMVIACRIVVDESMVCFSGVVSRTVCLQDMTRKSKVQYNNSIQTIQFSSPTRPDQQLGLKGLVNCPVNGLVQSEAPMRSEQFIYN